MKILRFLLLFAALPVFAQQAQFTAPDCEFAFRFSVVGGVVSSTTPLSASRLPLSSGGGNVVGYDNREKTCTSWNLMYQAEGVSGASLEIDSAPSAAGIPGSWTVWPAAQIALGATLPLTNTAAASITTYSYKPWVSVNLNSGTGTGQVWGRVLGWRPAPGQDSVTGATITSQNASATDPCQSSANAKSTAFVSITTATTTALVPVSGTTAIYVCGYLIGLSGTTTANTVIFQQGTGSTCAGAPTAISMTHRGIGSSGGNALNFPVGNAGQTVFKTAAANGLCALTTVATAPNIDIQVTYVQQ